MENKRKYILRYLPLAIVWILAESLKHNTRWITYYTYHLSPHISNMLNQFSSLYRFSLYDYFILLTGVALLVTLIACFRKKTRKKGLYLLLSEITFLYVSFYFLWGYNYYADGFLKRNHLQTATFDSVRFDQFLVSYIDQLNRHYVVPQHYSNKKIDSLLQESAIRLQQQYPDFGFNGKGSVKQISFGRLYAAMGIRGYYGPFFSEVHISPLSQPIEHGALQAHERAHLSGITAEADANLYGYLLTTRSHDPQMQFSGYYSLLPYILRNSQGILSPHRFDALFQQIDPRIQTLYLNNRNHWQSLYSRPIGAVQGWLYDLFLKSNEVEGGLHNYSEVLSRVISVEQYEQQMHSIHTKK